MWTEKLYRWDAAGELYEKWSFDTDWKPEPQLGFEPMFQPALDDGADRVPGAGGTLWMLDRDDRRACCARSQPFGPPDPDTYVAGGIAVAPDGTIYYNAIKLDHDPPATTARRRRGSSRSAPDGTVRTADYATSSRARPQPDDLCVGEYQFGHDPLPWPPVDASGTIVPPTPVPCGAAAPGHQRHAGDRPRRHDLRHVDARSVNPRYCVHRRDQPRPHAEVGDLAARPR